jgi:membrane associated rhomboid family serine protease
MRWIDKLERRLGFIAVPGLARVLVGFTALVFVLGYLSPDFISALDLDPARIRRGEVWRLVTYIFIPPTPSWLWILFSLWFLWWIGEGLERAIGSFQFTLYFLVGMIGTTGAAFVFGSRFSNIMLVASLFYGFARFYPDEVIYVFFILPLKIKWIAWISAALLLAGFFLGTMSYRMALVAAFANYLIFFGGEIWTDARSRRDVTTRRRRFETEQRSEAEPLHRCQVCGATELTQPDLEFRVARDGEEYCMPHLPKADPAGP